MDDLKIITTVTQGGSFALLSYIAWWMMRSIPEYLKRQEDSREKEMASRESMARDMLATFAEQQRYEREQCAHQFAQLAEGLREHRQLLDSMRGTVDASLSMMREHHQFAQASIRDLSSAGKK